ncbi:CCAAT/enhancer-binding protein zeta [Microcaecilia unicolor]|uniref:CCAAT/enhancer-binding protein zeta n=1 Tax=Microcaecilia unicolor TaxID=1415580 RepID=A0A6P7XEI8_9AMPH|nr:CCAAT/enhancer-binding protein zeta [Microcaecilia unicolor]
MALVGESEDCETEEITDVDGLNLEDVLQLGGTKQDFIMLAALEEPEELVDGGKKGAIDDLKEGELESFISKLGFHNFSESVLQQKEKMPVKKEQNSKTEIQTKLDKNKDGKTKKEKISTVGDNKKKPVQLNEVSSTSGAGRKKAKQQNVFEFNAKQILLIKPGGKWYDLEYTKEYTSEPQNETDVSKYKALAQNLYEHEAYLYKSKKDLKKGANSAWMKTVVSSGTLADRMAAMTLLIQDAAIHTLQFLETLVNLVRKQGSRRQSLMALDTLKELLLSDLLPDNCKLHTFSQHPFNRLEEMSSGNRDARDRRLIIWYFEHQLKQHVTEFLQVLETMSHDTLLATKTRVLTVIHELLCNKPEGEKILLVQLVNKLGDPQYRLATKASYLLETLLHKHPNMKVVVCREVERLLYRPNISPKAQYYGICFLNQTILSHEESELANKLITIYFSFFRSCVKKKDMESKMLRALLMGVNRAYPYSQAGNEKVKEQLDTLFKIVHLVNFNTSVQALMLLFQVMDSQQTVSNRYYAALYRKLLDPGLALCSKQSMFLNLVYKSMKADVVLRRVKAFVKRLLQVACAQLPPFICGALYLVSEILRMKPGLRVLLQEQGESDEEEVFQDLNEDDDEVKTFTDVGKKMEAERGSKLVNSNPPASWVHHQNLKGEKNLCVYDPLNRNPLFCGADHTCLWELKKFVEHFHPSVALFAKTILQGNSIQYSGDPLQDFTLMRFLDRFVYRNPKLHITKENTHNVVMRPKRKLFMNDVRSFAVNSKEFLEQEESKIPVDEVFFHRFYKKLDKSKQKKKRHEDEESVEDVDDDEFEKLLDSVEGDNLDIAFNDNLDFAGNIKTSKVCKRSDEEEDDDSDWDIADDKDLDNEEVSLSSMDEDDFVDDAVETGGSFVDLSDDDNEDNQGNVNVDAREASKFRSKRKVSEDINFAGSFKGSKQGKKKRSCKDSVGMFAAAEEFGFLLDENAGSQFDNIGMNAMANRDNASVKQLKWEAERDNWLHNRDAKSIVRKKNKFKYKKMKNKQKCKM